MVNPVWGVSHCCFGWHEVGERKPILNSSATFLHSGKADRGNSPGRIVVFFSGKIAAKYVLLFSEAHIAF